MVGVGLAMITPTPITMANGLDQNQKAWPWVILSWDRTATILSESESAHY